MPLSGNQDTQQIVILDKAWYSSEVVYLLAKYSLFSFNRTAINISFHGSNKNFFLSRRLFCDIKRHCPNHVVVSSCYVVICITDIFAYFANLHLDVIYIYHYNIIISSTSDNKIWKRIRCNRVKPFFHATLENVQLYNKVRVNINIHWI